MNLTKPQISIYNMVKYSGAAISNNCSAMLIKGEKNEEELQFAVNELFRLNDALRIRIKETSDDVTQFTTDFLKQKFDVLYFNDENELDNYAKSYVKKPLDLYGPLCSLKIVILPGQYGILALIHHIISDAWTFSILASQFNAILNNEDAVGYSYFDYIETEDKYLNSKKYTKDKSFFLHQIKSCETVCFIKPKKIKTLAASRKVFNLNKDISQKIRTYASESGFSIFSFFAFSLATYISKINNNTEKFFIGTTTLNRSTEKELHTCGTFVNTVPVFIKLDYSESALYNIESVNDALFSVLRHQKYTYTDIITDETHESAKHYKLYDTMISYMNAAVEKSDKVFHTSWYFNGCQNESLQLNIDDRDNDGFFKIHYDYQTEKFTACDIEILHELLMRILSVTLENPKIKLSELCILTDKEKKKILFDFNDTEKHYDLPPNATLYSLFEKTAEENRDKICIFTEKEKITFGELLKISEAVDNEIRKETKGIKSTVAVIADRSLEMYGAIYGIIRGGNAYLPIAPDYPKKRIEYILKNSKTTLIIAQEKYTGLSGDTICIDMTKIIKNLDDDREKTKVEANENDIAYVIYTSGSTGEPKGAMISHKSAVNRIVWMQDFYPLKEEDVILQKTPYTFDVSVWEIFWWGMFGEKLAISKPGEHFLPAQILNEVYAAKVTHIHFVPSVFNLFLSYIENHKSEIYKFKSVKHVFLSGEALTVSLVKRFYELYDYSVVKLHNLYGPTECAVDVTYYDCVPDDFDPIPIGKPISNTHIYVMDKYLNVLPIGVTGELYIGGANVGQGYLNNPCLTAEKFVDDPFGEGKIYKTGDLAYWRNDGNIVFCGRTDGQIKLHGQRIELGEVEAVLLKNEGITAAAVVALKQDEKDLIAAYYTGEKAEQRKLKAYCRGKLPTYMIPSVFVFLEKLPLNQSGKLDRRELESFILPITDSVDKFEDPINETEKKFCEEFKKIFKENYIDRNSDFYDLGGTSLDLIALLSDDFFSGISVSDFVDNPTPAKLAKLIGKKRVSTFKKLQCLAENAEAKKAVVIFPYAGGSVAGFASLVNELKKQSDGISVYYCDYPDSVCNCNEIAEDILSLSSDLKIYLYGHCVGSTPAIMITEMLENQGSQIIENITVGGSIPPKKAMRFNLWKIVPDSVLGAVLSKAGGSIKNLPKHMRKIILHDFRKNADFSLDFYRIGSHKVSVPINVILSKDDMFTINYKQAESIWGTYSKGGVNIRFINSKSHYFQAENSAETASLIAEFITDM